MKANGLAAVPRDLSEQTKENPQMLTSQSIYRFVYFMLTRERLAKYGTDKSCLKMWQHELGMATVLTKSGCRKLLDPLKC